MERFSIDRSIISKQNPLYLLIAAISLLIFILSYVVARRRSVSEIEQQVFDYIANLHDSIEPILGFFTDLGSASSVFLVALILLFVRRWRLSLQVLIAGFLAALASQLMKILVERGRPADILGDAQIRALSDSGFGFPSTRTAIVFALAMTLSAFLGKRLRIIVWLVAILVAVSRLYVGAHLPLDVIGGAALGLVIGASIRFFLGSPNLSRSKDHVIAALSSAGIDVDKVKTPNVDARGSAPYFVSTKDHKKLFAKIITSENRIADMLFKTWRSIIYQDFEDETPYFSAKQALEHEAYITLLADTKKISVPSIRYVIATNREFAILVLDQLDGKSLDSYPKSKITDELATNIWKEVHKLHHAQIAHRDLRLANVFVLSSGQPMLIDFSFGESYASERRMLMDVVELLVSLSLVIGPSRAVSTALHAYDASIIVSSSKYLQAGALAGATRDALKAKPMLLENLRTEIYDQTKLQLPDLISLTRVRLSVGWFIIVVVGLVIWWIISL